MPTTRPGGRFGDRRDGITHRFPSGARLSKLGMLIINADDFGHSPETNAAIAQAFSEGLVSSTTIMANGAGFEDACGLAAKQGLANRVGIHLNLTEGAPLSEPIKQSAIFCDSTGRLSFKRFRHWILTPRDRRALRWELDAQIDRCRARGLRLTHADSHHHSHTEPALFPVVAATLRRQGIPFLRLSDNVRGARPPRRCYKLLYNLAVRAINLRGADYFCDLTNLPALAGYLDDPAVVVEVMVHPAYDRQGRLIDAQAKRSLEELVRPTIERSALCSYGELRS